MSHFFFITLMDFIFLIHILNKKIEYVKTKENIEILYL